MFLLLHDSTLQLKANELTVFLPSIWSIHKRYENRYLSTFRGEIIGLSILWIFWIAGAAGATVSGWHPPLPLSHSGILMSATLLPLALMGKFILVSAFRSLSRALGTCRLRVARLDHA